LPALEGVLSQGRDELCGLDASFAQLEEALNA